MYPNEFSGLLMSGIYATVMSGIPRVRFLQLYITFLKQFFLRKGAIPSRMSNGYGTLHRSISISPYSSTSILFKQHINSGSTMVSSGV